MLSHEHPAAPRLRPEQRSTGAIVCALGVVQLLLGLFSAPKGSIKFELLGLIAGLLIWYGSPRVLAVVRWLALFCVGGALFEIVKPTLLMPVDLTFTQLRLLPAAAAMFYLPLFLSAAVVLVIALRLGDGDDLPAPAGTRRNMLRTCLPLILGAVLVLGVGVTQYRVLNGDDAQQARQMVAEQYGPRYRYYTNFVHFQFGGSGHVAATVQAWNANEVLLIPVRWKK